MNRLILGILSGIAFGLIDALMVVFGDNPGKSTAMLLQAFLSQKSS